VKAEFPVVIIIGTRPEGIKMAPVYLALKRAGITVILVSTMQRDKLLAEVFDLFGIAADYYLDSVNSSQDLFYVTQTVLQKTKDLFRSLNPLLVLVQGDTTSSMASSLAAFYLGIPVGHVEAGLRTDDVHNPFPEEMNRRVIGVVANFHFAPTSAAVANILAHGVRRDSVFCTGNTVIDALHIVKEKLSLGGCVIDPELKKQVKFAQERNMHIALLTLHRHESFEGGVERVLQTVKDSQASNQDILWIYPYYSNPYVVEAIQKIALYDTPNIYLSEQLKYSDMVYALDAADFVLTDSSGIQEEAVSLGKPVLVLREKTERMEGVLAGRARVVGTNVDKIIQGIAWALEESCKKKSHSAHDLYGDGHAAEKIVAFIQSRYDQLNESASVREMKEKPIHVHVANAMDYWRDEPEIVSMNQDGAKEQGV
jgi:UDP-N-acetylglucosamine 2-epimerase (non-hydrolysing)